MSSGHDGGKILLSLQQRQKWTVSWNDVCVDNVVIVKDDNSP